MNCKERRFFGFIALFIMLAVLPAFCCRTAASETMAADVSHPSEVTNVLLIGSDTREPGSYGNSDAMVMVTINHAAKKIFLVSFMRDLYADIPGYGVQKLNAAHAAGGGELLEETIAYNYQVKADNYLETEFSTMAELIDLLGGITLDLDTGEVDVANAYIEVMCQEQGLSYEDNMIKGEGTIDLTGIQAVGYARNRVTGNDYERTARQRKVLIRMIGKLKGLNPVQIMDIAVTILPKLHTDLGLTDLVSLISQVPAASGYELVTDRVPYDDLFHSENEILVPEMDQTISRLLDEIYEGCR